MAILARIWASVGAVHLADMGAPRSGTICSHTTLQPCATFDAHKYLSIPFTMSPILRMTSDFAQVLRYAFHSVLMFAVFVLFD